MAVDESRILKATTNLYKGVTLPSSNTFTTLTAGLPASGEHAGAIGAIDVSPGVEVVEKDSENQLSILGASISAHSLELTIRLKEWTTQGLSWLTSARRMGNGFFLGSSTTLEYDSVCVVWEFDDDVYGYLLAYKAYVSSPASISPTKGDFAEFEATLTCVADTTRDKNDRLAQVWLPDGYNDFA